VCACIYCILVYISADFSGKTVVTEQAVVGLAWLKRSQKNNDSLLLSAIALYSTKRDETKPPAAKKRSTFYLHAHSSTAQTQIPQQRATNKKINRESRIATITTYSLYIILHMENASIKYKIEVEQSCESYFSSLSSVPLLHNQDRQH
jgi:hypothetical protein